MRRSASKGSDGYSLRRRVLRLGFATLGGCGLGRLSRVSRKWSFLKRRPRPISANGMAAKATALRRHPARVQRASGRAPTLSAGFRSDVPAEVGILRFWRPCA
jgi:hypothetical protein